MSRAYILPGSQNDTFTPPGAEVNGVAVEQALRATTASLDTIKATCAKRMICGAFQYSREIHNEGTKRGSIHISDIRCAAHTCPSVIDNALNPTKIIEL